MRASKPSHSVARRPLQGALRQIPLGLHLQPPGDPPHQMLSVRRARILPEQFAVTRARSSPRRMPPNRFISTYVAELARQGKISGDAAKLAASGLAAFEQRLSDYLVNERHPFKP